MSHIQREIQEQPDVIRRLLDQGMPIAQRIAAAIREFSPSFVLIAARGTSDNAGRYAQYLFGTHARLVTSLAAPSLHTLYESAPHLDRALVIGISQSGQSEDVRRVIVDGRKQGALTVSITNAPESPLAQEAQYHLPIFAGEEISVAATKSYTGQLAALALLIANLIGDDDMQKTLAYVPHWVAETLSFAEPIQQWAARYAYMERFASIGRGYNYCTAFEISLKIKELCYITGVEYSEADFMHGPIALVQPRLPVLLVAPEGKTLPRMLNLITQLQARLAVPLVITNNEQAKDMAAMVMPIPANVPEWASPMMTVIPGQVFAMSLALAIGNNLDRPTGLSKVTITE